MHLFPLGTYREFWSQEEASGHINFLVLTAIYRALRFFDSQITGLHVRILSDNATAVSYINLQGGTLSHSLSSSIGYLELVLSQEHPPLCQPYPRSGLFGGRFSFQRHASTCRVDNSSLSLSQDFSGRSSSRDRSFCVLSNLLPSQVFVLEYRISMLGN